MNASPNASRLLAPLFVALALGCGVADEQPIKVTDFARLKESFKPYLGDYADLLVGLEAKPLPEIEPAQAHLSGKILPVERRGKELVLDDSFLYLPRGMLATKNEEVGTLVWMRFGGDTFQTATKGTDVTVVSALDVVAIELSSGRVIARKSFSVPAPAAEEPLTLEQAGALKSQLHSQGVEYLKGLPRK